LRAYKIGENESKVLFYDLKNSNYIDMAYDTGMDQVCILTYSLASKKAIKISYDKGISSIKLAKDQYYCFILNNEGKIEKKYNFTCPLVKIFSCLNGKYILLGAAENS
jgi:hypothetical protein